MMIKKLLILCFVAVSTGAFSQDKVTYTTTNSKAIKHMEKAKEMFDQRKDDLALESLNKALKEDPAFAEAYAFKGEILMEKNRPESALDQFKKVIELAPKLMPNVYAQAGFIEMYMGSYSDAKKHFTDFLAFNTSNAEYKKQAQFQLKCAEFGEIAVKNPKPFDPKNMGPNVNSKAYEYFPAITADDKTLLITRNERDEATGRLTQEDFYISFFQSGKWTPAIPINDINTPNNEGAPTLSADASYIFFSACERPDGKGSCDIYLSKRTGINWAKPRNIGPPINTRYWETQPSFSSDGKTLYFVSNRPGGQGKGDIWMSTVSDKGWSEPVNLGPEINTPGDEESPFIHPDTKTLYFSSNGHVGLGGNDFFMAKAGEDGKFHNPVNLGYPINTSRDESSIIVSGSGKYGYFTSEREGGLGGLDIYQFEMDPSIRPDPITYFKGKVYDKETSKPLEARFELMDLDNGKMVVQSTSNGQTGEFFVSLPTSHNYALNVNKQGYMFYSENFSLKDNKGDKPYLMDVPLVPIKVGEKVILKNIFFETGKFNLKPESKIELNKLVNFLSSNPTVAIEISGHTDNVGKKTDNQTLSNNRAKAVYDYLVTNGIVATRLKYAGYADTQPIKTNDTEEGRAANRRTEFKVVAN